MSPAEATLVEHGDGDGHQSRVSDQRGAPDHQHWFKRACGAVPLIREPDEPGAPRVMLRAVLTNFTNMWENGSVITYSFLGSSLNPDDIRQKKIAATVMEWCRYANLLFLPVESDGMLRITFNGRTGSWSYIGRENLKVKPTKPTMNLGWIDDLSPNISTFDRGTILHEFGHAIGLEHEHQSPLRDGTITLDEEAVNKFYVNTQGWKPDRVKEQIINKITADKVSAVSAYDSKSIMHYFMPADMNIQRKEFPPNYELSETDKAFIVINYPPDPDTEEGFEVLQQAFQTLGVPEEKQDELLMLIKVDPTADEARHAFKDWNETHLNPPSPPSPSEASDSVPQDDAMLVDDSLIVEDEATASSPDTSEVQTSSDVTFGEDGPEAGLFDPEAFDTPSPANQAQKAEARRGPFLEVLLEKMKQFFNPGAGQILTLQFPGRYIQPSLYAWDTYGGSVYGHFIKPAVVNESEFRLVDQLYDVAEVVSAPNGQNISVVYEQVLNNLIPKYADGNFAAHQQRVKAWLMEPVEVSSWAKKLFKEPNSKSSSGAYGTLTRLELSEALMHEYLIAKQSWELERDALIEEASSLNSGLPGSSANLASSSRKLAHLTAAREAQLSIKHADAVVYGLYHTVRQNLGYMDIKTAPEFLQDAKEAYRVAQMLSVDGISKVFPVQLSPIDWFRGLESSFTLEDLVSDPSSILRDIDAKSKELDSLNVQLVGLMQSSRGDVAALEGATRKAQNDYDKVSSELSQKYSYQVTELARTCLGLDGKVDRVRLATRAASLNLSQSQLNELAEGTERIKQASDELLTASRALSRELAFVSKSMAATSLREWQEIEARIVSLTGDLSRLTARYQALNTTSAGPAGPVADPTGGSINDIPLFPIGDHTSGGARWEDITMFHEIDNDYSESSAASSGAVSSSHVNLFFGSTSSRTSASAGSSTAQFTNIKQRVELGLRVTLVTIDRGGWFQPQFFKQSKAYYRDNDYISWTKYPEGVQTAEQLKADPSNFKLLNAGLLPAYPVAFLICKDITIRISNQSSENSTTAENIERQAAVSGGILCFSYDGGSTEKDLSKVHSCNVCADGCVVRVPGPQILGYIMQLTDKDDSIPKPDAIPADFIIPEDETVDSTPAPDAHRGIRDAINSPGGGNRISQLDELLRSLGVDETGIESMHSALVKELTEKTCR